MEITITPFWAKIILILKISPRIHIMCRGYSEDYDNFTELGLEDIDLDFYDRETYPQFQIWYF